MSDFMSRDTTYHPVVPRNEVPEIVSQWADRMFHYGQPGHCPWEWRGGRHIFALVKKGQVTRRVKMPRYIMEELEDEGIL